MLVAKRLIEQLGSERYSAREAATIQLTRLPTPPTAELRLATNSENLEIRARAKRILRQARPLRSELMHAVLATIEQKKIPGLASELLQTAPLCDTHYQQSALQAAMERSVSKISGFTAFMPMTLSTCRLCGECSRSQGVGACCCQNPAIVLTDSQRCSRGRPQGAVRRQTGFCRQA